MLTTKSTGNIIFPLAFSNKDFAKSNLSFSTMEVPILYPKVFMKVYAIPPPIKILSAFFSKFSITPILSLTLAPPKIATKGFSGLSTASPI